MESLYGLSKGQYRDHGLVRNGVWFSHHWKMLGWGDLTDHDLVRIAREIPFGQLFIVIAIGGVWPLDRLIDQCSWLVERGRIYAVAGHSVETASLRQVRYHQIDHETARSIVARISRLYS
jgi:hypothetical protein